MAGNLIIPHTFGPDAGPEALNLLDTCYGSLVTLLNALATFANYYLDAGAVNALSITLAANQTFSYSDGLRVDVKVANANTSITPTLNINAAGAKTITDAAGNPLLVGAMVAGGYYHFQYDGTNFRLLNPTAFVLPDGATNYFQAGYLDAPPNLQNANYGFVLSDRGKGVEHTSASAHTWTIPANSVTSFPGGSILLLANNGNGALTLAITTDVLVWLPSGNTGSRTIAANGFATLRKTSTATVWNVFGGGIT